MANVYLNHTVTDLDDAISKFQSSWRDVSSVTASSSNMLKNTIAVNTTGQVQGEIEILSGNISSSNITNNEQQSNISVSLPSNNYYSDVNLQLNYADIANSIQLQPNQIVQGNVILGVAGTFSASSQQKTVSASSTSDITVLPDSAYDYLSQVTVLQITPDDLDNTTVYNAVQDKNLNYTLNIPSITKQGATYNADSGKYISKVVLPAVTSSIDSNIQEQNIKSGITILGVTGTYGGESGFPIEVETESEMNSYLSDNNNLGKIFKYTGITTTDTAYTQGELYIMAQVEDIPIE